VKKGNAAKPQVRVKWQGLPDTSTTREDWYKLINRFPSVTSRGQGGSSMGEDGAGVIPAQEVEDGK
jgi:hypothetical protein